MLTIKDFISKYENYTDEELYNVYKNMDGYSNEAQQALGVVLENKGGIESIITKLKEKQIVNNEITRIAKETTELGRGGIDSSFIKTTTSSAILSQEQVNAIIDSKYAEVELELEDKKIKPNTILGSILGCGVATLVGGTLWGLQMIYSNAIFYMLLIGLALLCYGIIKLFTKKSKNNNAVLIATFVAFILSILLGDFLYQLIGYRG